MRPILIFIIGLFFGLFNLSAQEQRYEEKEYIPVPCYFRYPGGDDGLRKYFNSFFFDSNYQKEGLAEGKIVVSFIVNKKGVCKNPQIFHSTNPKLDNMVIESINKMIMWIPDFNCKNESLLVIIPFYFGNIPITEKDNIETVILDGIYLSKPVVIRHIVKIMADEK